LQYISTYVFAHQTRNPFGRNFIFTLKHTRYKQLTQEKTKKLRDTIQCRYEKWKDILDDLLSLNNLDTVFTENRQYTRLWNTIFALEDFRILKTVEEPNIDTITFEKSRLAPALESTYLLVGNMIDQVQSKAVTKRVYATVLGERG
jgi:hypothetical protein